MTSGGGSGRLVAVGADFFDQRQDADNERAAADQHDAHNEKVADPTRNQRYRLKMNPSAWASNHSLPEKAGASSSACFAQQVGHGDELEAVGAKLIDDYRGKSGDGLAAVAAAVVKQNDVAGVGLLKTPSTISCGGHLLAVGLLQSCGSIFWPTMT